jgi:hypothetical protein
VTTTTSQRTLTRTTTTGTSLLPDWLTSIAPKRSECGLPSPLEVVDETAGALLNVT